MRLNETINRFALVSGLEPCEVSKWTVLCVDATKEIERMILPCAVLTQDNELRLSNAAGVLAYYKYCMYSHVTKVKGFAAGNVSVTVSEDEAEHAFKLWQTEKEAIGDLIGTESGFCFQGVRI